MNSKAILINLTNAHIPLDIFPYIDSTRISKFCNAFVLSCIHLSKTVKMKNVSLYYLHNWVRKLKGLSIKLLHKLSPSPFTFKIMFLHAEYESLHNFSVVIENNCPYIGCLCKILCNLSKFMSYLLCTQYLISITFLIMKFIIEYKT